MTYLDILSIEEMRHLKKQLGYTNEMLAAKSGVPLGTVQKIMAGITKSPRQKTLKALSDALLWQRIAISPERDGSGWYEQYLALAESSLRHGPRADVVSEAAAVYGSQKRLYTTKDIEALPDGVRAELVDGEIFYMATPSRTHQKIAGEMHLIVASYIRSSGGSCEVYIAPFAVWPDNDDYTYFEPDLSVICDMDKLDEKGCHGAPDWIVEVMSPSSKKMDCIRKFEKYRKARVREYWIIIPEKRMVVVYNFETEDDSKSATLYSFDDEIPSGIYPELKINLSQF